MDYKLSNRSYGKTIEQSNKDITEFLIRVFSNLIEKDLRGVTEDSVLELMHKEKFGLVQPVGDRGHLYDVYLKDKKFGEIRLNTDFRTPKDAFSWNIKCKVEFIESKEQ